MNQLISMIAVFDAERALDAFLNSCFFPIAVVVGVALGVMGAILGNDGGGGGVATRGDVNPSPPMRPFQECNPHIGTNTRRAQPREIIDEVL